MKKNISPPLIDPEIGRRKVLFSKEYLIKRGEFSLRRTSQRQKETLCKKLKQFRELTLFDFLVNNSAQLRIYHPKKKWTPPKNLSKDIIDEGISRFRINDKIRVLGYRSEHVFYIVWIDWYHKTG